MHGTNPLRKQQLDDGSRLYIEDVFYTIQGEGPFAGTPAVFVRLSGCWLACTYCDTQFEQGMRRDPCTVEYILRSVIRLSIHNGRHATDLVVLTGGDPLRQNIAPLVEALTDHYFHVQIETAGLQWVPSLEDRITREVALHPRPGYTSLVCSPKTGLVHYFVHDTACAWKYVVRATDTFDDHDGLPNTSTQNDLPQPLARPNREVQIYLQPCYDDDPVKTLANQDKCVELAMQYGYRISLQQHRILNVP